jgi:hypothetical protein
MFMSPPLGALWLIGLGKLDMSAKQLSRRSLVWGCGAKMWGSRKSKRDGDDVACQPHALVSLVRSTDMTKTA